MPKQVEKIYYGWKYQMKCISRQQWDIKFPAIYRHRYIFIAMDKQTAVTGKTHIEKKWNQDRGEIIRYLVFFYFST